MMRCYMSTRTSGSAANCRVAKRTPGFCTHQRISKAVPRREACLRRAAPTDLFALDFDGVLVDSEPEVSQSGFRAAKLYWPDLFEGIDAATEERILQGLKRVRPVLVVGHETMAMARMFLEDAESEKVILNGWPDIFDAKLKDWGVDGKELRSFFEAFRNKWMNEQSDNWLAFNRSYPKVGEALKSTDQPFYLVSSKQAPRVSKLFEAEFGIPMPVDSPRLFAGLLPPEEKKIEALRLISDRPLAQSGVRLHFVDDRIDTLKAIQGAADLSNWQLYFADWGYSTDADKEEAKKTPGIKVLSLPAFRELLTWGIVMGVDDGCEPTPEEVEAAVHRPRRDLDDE